jgi:hypothetical protein
LCGETLSREECKQQVRERSNVNMFAKPKKGKSGIYAIVMDSDRFFYDRYTVEIDTYCFNCHKPIKGHAKDFPKFDPVYYDERFDTEAENQIEYNTDEKFHFCSYTCKQETTSRLRGDEGEWQVREGYNKTGAFGYIYHIYNRTENKHYIGQTKYMPFFRWQEHVKAQQKGDICDLVFETITKVPVKSQEYLNNIEAWWIQKYIDGYGKENVMNLTNPKITVSHLVEQYNNMIKSI